MSKIIIFAQEGNKLGVAYPATNLLPIEEIARRSAPAGSPVAFVDHLDIFDPLFDAYEYQNGQAVLNVEKAKEIQRNRWRAARAPKLAALDAEFAKALERDDEMAKATIAGKKQALRDAPATPFPSDEPEAIWGFWPACLS